MKLLGAVYLQHIMISVKKKKSRRYWRAHISGNFCVFQGNTPSRLAFLANDQELGAYLQCKYACLLFPD